MHAINLGLRGITHFHPPAQGRFLTRDPFSGVLNLPQTLNPYAYATNNPVNLTDPSGQIVPLILLGVFVAGGFLGGVGAYTIQAYRYPDPCEGVQWDPVHALVWGGGGGLLGLGMYGVGYGGYALAIHFGWMAPGAAPAAIAATRVSVQRYGSTAWNYGRGLLRPAVVRANHSARIVQGPLTRLEKGKIRSQARAILGEVNPDFMKYVDSLGENIEVHHRIPLEYAHLFPGEDPNRLTNLYGLSAQFHRQVINPAWTAFRVTNPNPTIEEVLLYAAEVDRLIPWNITLYY